jgi:hypothetical protein
LEKNIGEYSYFAGSSYPMSKLPLILIYLILVVLAVACNYKAIVDVRDFILHSF